MSFDTKELEKNVSKYVGIFFRLPKKVQIFIIIYVILLVFTFFRFLFSTGIVATFSSFHNISKLLLISFVGSFLATIGIFLYYYIFKFIRYFYKKKDQKMKQKEFWLSLNGREFELQLAQVYRGLGYKVEVSKQGGDGGIDLFLRKGKEKIIVQCKAHDKPIGPYAVRDLYGTMVSHEVDKAVLASISGFTHEAYAFAGSKPMQLITLDDILKL